MNTFYYLTLGNIAKAYKNPIFIYTLVAIPVIITAHGLLFVGLSNMTTFTRIAQEQNLWVGFYLAQYLFISVFAIITSNILIFILWHTESTWNTWKYLVTLPVSIHQHVLSKVITALLIVIGINILIALSLLLNASILPIIYDQEFSAFSASLKPLSVLTIKLIILSIPICLIHTMLSLLIKRPSIMLLLSIFLPIACIYNVLNYLPYGWPIQNFWLTIKNKYEYQDWYPLLSTYEYWSIGITLFLFVAVFSKREQLVTPKLFLK